MKEIPLTKGKVALVDDGDFEYLSQWKWAANKNRNTFYAYRYGFDKIKNKKTGIIMHREILGFPENLEVDHINNNGLDNRKENLRTCSRLQNSQNTIKRDNCKSIFKGVEYHKKTNKFRATVCSRGNKHRSKWFKTELEAASAYDELAKKFFGEFAHLNLQDQNSV